jgi:SAM-dependent methyltransferase
MKPSGSWDPVWEQVFKSREWGRYPPEDLIRFVARNFYPARDRSRVKLLELGCGTGANIWYMAREGFDVYGVDGSPTAITCAKQRLEAEHLPAHLKVGDITKLEQLFPPASQFDAIIDVCCLQHNRLSNVVRILSQALARLRPGGKVFSMLIAGDSMSKASGREIEPGTFVDITSGPYAGIGLTHFFTLKETKKLFSVFTSLQIEHSIRSFNQRKDTNKHWVVQGAKPE